MAQKNRPQAETLYGLPQPLQTGILIPIIAKRDPTTLDTGYGLGQPWNNKVLNTYWVMTSVAAGVANWSELSNTGGGAGVFSSLVVNGPSTLVGVTNINATGTAATNIGGAGGTTTITGTMSVAGPALFSGGATFSLVEGAVIFNGGSIYAVATPAAGASPVTANGRTVVASFTGVSIASGASQAFVIANTFITSNTQQYQLNWIGATAGSGLSVASVALDGTAHTATITMTNATSATMVTSTANLIFTMQLLT